MQSKKGLEILEDLFEVTGTGVCGNYIFKGASKEKYEQLIRSKALLKEDMRDMYAGTAPYLLTEQKEEKRPVGRPRKRKHTGGRPKNIVK